jgi:hypothetical protein
MTTVSLHLQQARIGKPLLFTVMFSSLGWALDHYAHSNEVLSLNMPPFLVAKQLTELGSLAVSLAVICWFLAFLSLLPALVRLMSRIQSRLKNPAPFPGTRNHMRSSATVMPPSYSSRQAATRFTSSQAG